MSDFNTVFGRAMAENLPGLAVSDVQMERFEILADALAEKNAVMNLTAITDTEGIAYKHFADSLVCAEYIPAGATLLDVGAGAGFPSLPIAILRPDVHVTALDSTGKKLDFIMYAAGKCGLTNVACLNARAEDASHLPEYRESFNCVTSRAVARLSMLCELCIPFVSVGGRFIALKGAGAAEEFDEAGKAFRILGCKTVKLHSSQLICGKEASGRAVIVAEKNAPTPDSYPRKFAQIKKSAL